MKLLYSVFLFLFFGHISAQTTMSNSLKFSLNKDLDSIVDVDYAAFQPSIIDLNYESLQISPSLDFQITTPVLKWHQTDTGRALIASGALVGLGLYTYKDEGFLNRVTVKNGINRYLPDFSNPLDDYLQYTPYAATFALDAFGVKSKHKLKRKTTTIATGALTSLLVIQGMKYGIDEKRPDGSTSNSFPSGHTATAFMGAHIFHKEYGDRSVYYSIGGYLMATITGMFRQLNDRHWVSDVLVGAGLGISIAEFSYFLNEKIYKDEGINIISTSKSLPNRQKPSYLAVKVGYASLTKSFVAPDAGFEAKNGFSMSVDGAWFLNRNFGIGAEVGFQSFPIQINESIQEKFQEMGYNLIFQPVGSTKYLIGPHLQLDLNKKYSIGVKTLFGTAQIADTKLFLQDIVIDNPSETDDIVYAQIRPVSNFAWTAGIYHRFLIGDRTALSLYLDYNATNLKSTLSYIKEFDPDLTVEYTQRPLNGTFNSISAGASFVVMLW